MLNIQQEHITMKAPDPRLKEFLRKAYILQLREGSFSAASLAREAGRSYGYTSSMLGRLLSLGYVKRVRKKALLGPGGKSGLRGFSPAGYVLARRGRNCIRVVLTGGVFDILHPGHLSILTESKKHGDVLVAVLARDSTIRRRKGRRPLLSENDRLQMVSSLRQVDVALLGLEPGLADTLKRVSPDLVCLGHDQNADMAWLKRVVKSRGMHMDIIKSGSILPEYSTTNILRKIKGR
jgi:rfaE bifunctional protein nucleotidyltransferase chain/domain